MTLLHRLSPPLQDWIAALRQKMGEPTWRDDPRFTTYVAVEQQWRNRFDPARAKPPSKRVQERLCHILHAQMIAIEVEEERPDWRHRDSLYASIEHDLVAIELGIIRLAGSLKYVEEVVFTPYHEGHGPNVEAFWERVASASLPYARKPNPIDAIRQRGHIADRVEYNRIIDGFTELVESGIPAEQLNTWIEDFEHRNS